MAPYASAMAMMVVPEAAARNLAWLEEEGYLSPHGFYDAIDFTPPRPGAPLHAAPCRTVMAHHSGMTLLALNHVLLGGPMPRRFLKTPACAAHDLLLQERSPQAVRPVVPATRDDDRRSQKSAAPRGSIVPFVKNAAALQPAGVPLGSEPSSSDERP